MHRLVCDEPAAVAPSRVFESMAGVVPPTPASAFCRRSYARGRRAAAKQTRPSPPGAIGARGLICRRVSNANTLKGRNGGECANRMEARLGARPLGALAQGGVSGVVAPATRRAAGRGSAGRVGSPRFPQPRR
jgi:hypothetical protein